MHDLAQMNWHDLRIALERTQNALIVAQAGLRAIYRDPASDLVTRVMASDALHRSKLAAEGSPLPQEETPY